MNPAIQQQITFLGTLDLKKTADFYEQTLGLPLVVDQTTCRIYSTAGSAYLGFCQRDEIAENRDRIVLTLVTDDVDGWALFLQEKGVKLDHPPRLNEQYQIYHFYLTDPNGYKIEIQKFLHPFGSAA